MTVPFWLFWVVVIPMFSIGWATVLTVLGHWWANR